MKRRPNFYGFGELYTVPDSLKDYAHRYLAARARKVDEISNTIYEKAITAYGADSFEQAVGQAVLNTKYIDIVRDAPGADSPLPDPPLPDSKD